MLSKKRIASCQSRSLSTMQEKITVMKAQWVDVDAGLLKQIETLEKTLSRCMDKLEKERGN